MSSNDEKTSLKRSNDDDETSKDKKFKSLIDFRGFYASKKGEREEMQDFHAVFDDFRQFLPKNEDLNGFSIENSSFYAVFDGHQGEKAAKFCAENLHKNLAAKFPESDVVQNLKRSFLEAYKKTDDDFLNEARKAKPVWKDGTTATAILILNRVAYITNVGDSRAILCRFKPQENKNIALTLTVDHNPSIFDERMRIQKSGGFVKDGRIMGQLEVSRSIGDGQYKNFGLTCVPDVRRCTVTENDRYILLACDGLWKTFSNQEVMDFIEKLQHEASQKIFDPHFKLDRKSLQLEFVCKALAAEAVRRGSGDNVTVVFINLHDF